MTGIGERLWRCFQIVLRTKETPKVISDRDRKVDAEIDALKDEVGSLTSKVETIQTQISDPFSNFARRINPPITRPKRPH
jgi:hypothetical protein